MTYDEEPQRLRDMQSWPGRSPLGPQLMQAASELEHLNSAETALLRRRLLGRHMARPRRIKMVLALAALGTFVSGGLVGAALTQMRVHSMVARTLTPVKPIGPPAKEASVRGTYREAAPVAPEVAMPKKIKAPHERLAARSPTSNHSKRPLEQTQNAGVPVDEPNAELGAIRHIFGLLKQPGMASAALELIRVHEASFPNGSFSQELQAARIQAYTASGQHALALQLLASVAETDLRVEQRLLRAELLAEMSRCSQARTDFDRVYDSTAAPQLRERALYGRALCWAQEGKDAQKQRDLYEYLFRFPDGPRAQLARRALGLTEVQP